MATVINFLMSNYIFPRTNFFFCYMLCLVIQLGGFVLLYFFEEELDVENLAKFNGIKIQKLAVDDLEKIDEDDRVANGESMD